MTCATADIGHTSIKMEEVAKQIFVMLPKKLDTLRADKLAFYRTQKFTRVKKT